jgi:hypothetical protein
LAALTNTHAVFLNVKCHYEYLDCLAYLFAWNGGYITISDSGADSWIIGQGWFTIHEMGRHANVLRFDHNIAKKLNLPIVITCELSIWWQTIRKS